MSANTQINPPQLTLVNCFAKSPWFRWVAPGIIAAHLTSCDTPQKKAIRELSQADIEISGKSLIEAVSEPDLERAALLLEAGAFTGQRNFDGHPALGIAVKNQDLNMVRLLLNGRADVNATYDGKTSVLGIAAEQGNPILIGLLLSSGARTDGLMPNGDRILPWAIRMGRADLMDLMMKADTDPHLKDHHGNPLLHIAMESGRRDLMDSLIELGADPGATNAAGETTLQLAIRRGWLDALPKLAAAGADPNARGPEGDTPLEQALASGKTDLAALLLKIGADPNLRGVNETASPLQKSLKQRDPALLKMLLNHGVTTPEGGWNPWFWHAYQQHDLEKIQLLLGHGLRPGPQTPGGPSMAETAVLTGRSNFIKLLLDYGCPVGRSLHIATLRGDPLLVELLLACGAPANVTRFPTKDTLLGTAIRLRHDAVAMRLLHYGANPNLSLPENQSTFHLAVATGCARTVKYFLNSGINPDTPFSQPVSNSYIRLFPPGAMRWMLKMDRNPTPLMAAADCGHIQTARYLMDAGAKTNARTRTPNMWPINFAANRGDVRMMRLFLGQDPYHEERIIEIHLSTQQAVMFDGEGREIFKTRVSTGKRGLPTPKGEYAITNKHREWTSTLYHASMPYFQRLSCGDFGMHQGVVPDYPASHGCIRVPAANAAKLFNMTQTGDRVRIME